MFRFEDPIYLYALLIIPMIVVLRWLMIHRQKKRMMRFADAELLKQLAPNVSRHRPLVKFWLLMGALALLIVMLARPQMGTKINHEKRTGIETIIAMDISNSMLAEDVTPSRLERAKMMVENLVDHFTNDKIGLIVFAGDAFVQLPITSDYVSAKMFLGNIDPSMIEVQGTDIAAAIRMAASSFTQEQGIGKAIIVITDGEDHEGGALEAARDAKEKGFRVFVLGIGSPKGSPIPISGTNDYIKDETGQTVMSALNEDMCKQVAEAGGGAYIHVENNANAQEQLNAELEKLSKKETSVTIYSDYDEQFPAVAILVLLLLIIEICVLEIRNPHLQKLHLFNRQKSTMIVVLFMLCGVSVFAQNDRDYVRKGNRHYRAGNYAEAETNYRKAIEKNDRNPQAIYNLGNALLLQRKDSAAVQQYQQAAKLETNAFRRAQAYHNMGTVCQTHKMYGEAIEAYKEALRNNPHDNETRYNLELCKRMQKQQQKDDKQDKKQDKKQQNKNTDQQKDKQKEQQKEQQQKPQMSKENAEQLLNAAMQEEKNTQQRIKRAQQQQRRRLPKNW